MKSAFALVIVSLLFLSACQIDITRESPDRQLYSLDAQRRASTVESTGEILYLENILVEPPFDSVEFHRRQDSRLYVADYQNRFVAPPNMLIRTAAREWMEQSGLFEAVVDTSSALNPTRQLEIRVIRLELRETNAVIELRALYSAVQGNRIFINEAYRSEQPFTSDPTEAWSQSLSDILSEIESDIAEVES